MKSVNIYEAKTNFSKLVERVGAGENIVISKSGKPVASLVPYSPKQTISYGKLKNKLKYKEAQFVGTDNEIQDMFYGNK